VISNVTTVQRSGGATMFFAVQNFIFWLNSVQSLLRLIEIRVVQVPVASLGHSKSILWYILAVLAIENCNL
jgi:hypothetical protein